MKRLAIPILLLLTVILFCYPAEAKTDSKIITHLDSFTFLNPSLSTNNSYVYNNFEFYLYSDLNNTYYEIELNNILISNGTITSFVKRIDYKCEFSNITRLVIMIGNDYYNYSSIYVFNYDMTERNETHDSDDIVFSKVEFENYVNRLKLKLFSADSVGWFSGMVISYVYIKEKKKEMIIEV